MRIENRIIAQIKRLIHLLISSTPSSLLVVFLEVSIQSQNPIPINRNVIGSAVSLQLVSIWQFTHLKFEALT